MNKEWQCDGDDGNTRASPLNNQTLSICLTLTLLLNSTQEWAFKWNVVTCAAYPEKFVRYNILAAFLQLSVGIFTMPQRTDSCSEA